MGGEFAVSGNPPMRCSLPRAESHGTVRPMGELLLLTIHLLPFTWSRPADTFVPGHPFFKKDGNERGKNPPYWRSRHCQMELRTTPRVSFSAMRSPSPIVFYIRACASTEAAPLRAT